MSYDLLGTAYGRNVYIFTPDPDAGRQAPAGYAAAAVILWSEWEAHDLIWTLNALYGGLADWTEFDRSSGARSFSFFGERADEASSICDALAFAWTQGSDAEYEDVMASSHDEDTVDAFVENLFSGEILAGDRYAGALTNLIFAVQSQDQAHSIRETIGGAIRRHAHD